MAASQPDHDAFAAPTPPPTATGPGDYFVPRSEDEGTAARPTQRSWRYRDRFRRQGTRRWPR